MKLAAWLELPKHLYAKLADGTKVRPTYDERQVGEERLSSVQYLKFEVGDDAPVAIGCDHSGPRAPSRDEAHRAPSARRSRATWTTDAGRHVGPARAPRAPGRPGSPYSGAGSWCRTARTSSVCASKSKVSARSFWIRSGVIRAA